MLAGIAAIICIAYLSNIGGGVVEVVPDNIPIVGNLDEVVASLILFFSLRFLRISFPSLSKKQLPNKAANSRRRRV